MRIVIVGGHLSPALAVIEKLKAEEVFYIGRKHAFEGDKAISAEYQ
jgi:UDP-N-acetylglucosamine:LPS N-acetylglucosamine transferase